jgi:hypothetical protein
MGDGKLLEMVLEVSPVAHLRFSSRSESPTSVVYLGV